MEAPVERRQKRRPFHHYKVPLQPLHPSFDLLTTAFSFFTPLFTLFLSVPNDTLLLLCIPVEHNPHYMPSISSSPSLTPASTSSLVPSFFTKILPMTAWVPPFFFLQFSMEVGTLPAFGWTWYL